MTLVFRSPSVGSEESMAIDLSMEHGYYEMEGEDSL